MTEHKELKRLAREAIRETKPSPVLVTLVVVVILAVLQYLMMNLNGELAAYITMVKSAAAGDMAALEAAVTASSTAVSFPAWLLILALNLMGMVVSMGYTLYCLRVSRRTSSGFPDVFDAFGRFFRVIVLTIVRSLLLSAVYTVPASVLALIMDPVVATVICLPLLIPMVMLAYAYRLADYLLLDNPRYPPIYCLSLSRAAMKGRKWDLFTLDLSFLGWIVLCLFPPVWLWVRPYMSVTAAKYYDAVMPGFAEWLKSQPIPRNPGEGGPGFWNMTGAPGASPQDPSDVGPSHNPGGWGVPGEDRPKDGDGGEDGDDDDIT